MNSVQGRTLNEDAGTAVLAGGPLDDGREHPVEPGTAELLVVMEDESRHVYVACPESREAARWADGARIRVSGA